jgi:periplasmic protein TonB
MRKYTLLISVIAHAGAVVALLLAPIFAVEILPELRDRSQWMAVVAAALPPSPPAPRTEPPRGPATTTPLEAPRGIQLEEPRSEPTDGVPGIDETLGTGNGTPFLGLGGGGDDRLEAPPPPPIRVPLPPVRVGGAIQRPVKVYDVPPAYPQLAVRGGVEGTVILEAIIGENGQVREVRVMKSIALLDDAAVDAVRQWRFTPTLLNGEPVPVLMTVTVGFRLNR